MLHVPVLVREVLEFLAIRPEGIYVDATAGLGGHTAAIAERLTSGFVIANDRDAESLEICRRNLAPFAGRVRFHQGRFSELAEALASFGVERADGLVADLGASLYQLTDPERGFSFSADAPLDMRMDRSAGRTAAEIVNTMAEKALAELIFRFGEERRARKIARAIVRARPVRTTLELARVIERVAPRTKRLHPATQTFMALRIAVNDELGELEKLLELMPRLVRSGGRAVVISFMSLEDRRVKHGFQALARQGRVRVLTRHVVRPSEQEVRSNPAARSARLRAVEFL